MSTPLRRSVRVRSSVVGLSAVSKVATSQIRAASTVTEVRSVKRVKIEVDKSGVALNETVLTIPKTISKPRKTKKVIVQTRPEDYSPRKESDWKVGAHVSAAGGVENSILNAAAISANAFALFVKSQRKWTSEPLSSTSIDLFRARLLAFNYHPDFILPHGSYLINLGNPDEEKREKSYACFVDDLRRCESLGLTRYNFHPGSTVGATTKEESISYIAACINRAHRETTGVTTVIENMAGSGNILGSKFEEIAQMIELVEDKSRVGAEKGHTFAATIAQGYDIRSKEEYETTLSSFERIIGLKYLRGLHLNDSKADLASHKDRHENIGRGKIALSTFGYIMRDPRLKHIPLILETPTSENSDVWKTEIEVLNGLSELAVDDDEGLRLLSKKIDEAIAVSQTKVKGKKQKVEKSVVGESKVKSGMKRKAARETEEEEDESSLSSLSH
ncbi:AP endonuclease [Hysterangium stoloniferum]|nr:AP endonuclease [Hysterangium stoloniferum]